MKGVPTMNNVIKLEGFNIPLMDFKLKELASSELPDYNILSATFWMDGEDFKGEEFREHMYNYLSDQLSVVKVDGHYRVRDNKTNKLLPKKADNMDKAVQLLISYRSKLADKLFEDGTVTVEKDYLDQSVSPYVF